MDQFQVAVLGELWTTHEVCSYTFKKEKFARTQALKKYTTYHLAQHLDALAKLFPSWKANENELLSTLPWFPSCLLTASSCPISYSSPSSWSFGILAFASPVASVPLLFSPGTWCHLRGLWFALHIRLHLPLAALSDSFAQFCQTLGLSPKASACVFIFVCVCVYVCGGHSWLKKKILINLFHHKNLFMGSKHLLPVLQHVYP